MKLVDADDDHHHKLGRDYPLPGKWGSCLCGWLRLYFLDAIYLYLLSLGFIIFPSLSPKLQDLLKEIGKKLVILQEI